MCDGVESVDVEWVGGTVSGLANRDVAVGESGTRLPGTGCGFLF